MKLDLDAPIDVALKDVFTVPQMGARLAHALTQRGVRTVRDLMALSEWDIKGLQNVGTKTRELLTRWLDGHRLALTKATRAPCQRRHQKPPDVPPRAYSIKKFCAAYDISSTTFFKMQRAGTGPRVMRVGHRTLISIEAADAWRRAREEETNEGASA